MRVNKNNLLPWFIQDHGSLPPAYLASCKKFFQELSNKPQASSNKLRQNVARQFVKFKSPGIRVKNRFQRKV
jgi:mRNA-degrading endonuclease RelE of RelBE toxin-antitoxin system|tara:strand:- start:1066 stop:1281 length:216 start_codon:yes stop_codon:yes gene_type:complete